MGSAERESFEFKPADEAESIKLQLNTGATNFSHRTYSSGF
jgi:hypothetical protein